MNAALPAPRPCSLPRRFAAVFYDSLLLGAVLFLATFVLLPFTGGLPVDGGSIAYRCYLLLVSWLYFAWQWRRGGTLGMRAWRIRLQTRDGGVPGWKDATLRFAAALLSWLPAGGGFLWALVDREGLALHDRLSRTELVIGIR